MAADGEIHFDQMQVAEPDFEQVKSDYRAMHEQLDAAEAVDDWLEVVWQWNELRRSIITWQSVVEIRFTQNTHDTAARDALERRDAMSPKLTESAVELMRRLIASPVRDQLEEKIGDTVFALWECEITTFEPAIKNDLVKESELNAKYTELLASAKLDYRGRQHTLSELARYGEDPERDVRHETAQIRWNWFGEEQQSLDEIYGELVALRHGMARKLGCEDFIELGYRRMQRIDYGPGDVERFRAQVREHVVPLCVELCKQQAERLGLQSLMQWDEAIHDPAGNPAPLGEHDWMLDRAEEMFTEFNEEMAALFHTMRHGQLLDLKSRDGKAPGGYCSGIESLRLPFIYANFNGTKGDVEVFTHEMGHAFQWYSSQAIDLVDYHWPTSESCEIHSMSLEFLTWPAMEKFFGDDAERFRRQHLTGSLLFLPYGVAVDHFQHQLYAKRDATCDERAAMWREMEQTYLPWRDWGDLAHPASGRRWQAQPHIYGAPFYYIDYTLALTCALQLWAFASVDRDAAIQKYLKLCRSGGTAPFGRMLREVELDSPFEDGCLRRVVDKAMAVLGC